MDKSQPSIVELWSDLVRLLLFPIFRKNQQQTQYMWTGLPVFSSALQAIGSLVGCLWNIFFPGQQGICVSGPTDPILNLPGCIITQKIRKRELTCEEIIRAFINRIYQVNPLLNAVVGDRFEEAMAEARYIDQVLDSDEPQYDEEKTSLLRKPLLGVPVTVKESLACKGLPHSAGLVDRKDAIATEDAIVVENLRKAGAIPIAVTNCSEVCVWFETDNVLYGRTNNPYDTSKMAGGSSGGEGSIISAAGSVCGVGSDVAGSVRIPALFNGIFAHKPSPLVVSNKGHMPGGNTYACDKYLAMGPMCRYADDLVPMLQAMAGSEAHKLGLDEKVDLSYIKVYTVHESHFPLLSTSPVNSELMERLKQACTFLQERFFATVKDAGIKSFQYSPFIWLSMFDIQSDKLSTQLQHYNKEAKMLNPFTEIFKSFLGYSKYHWFTMAFIGMEFIYQYCPGALSKFLILGTQMRKEIQDLLGNDGVLLYPSYPHSALPHQRVFLAPMNFTFSGIFNVMNLPVTQCPLGLDREGLPLGIQIVAGRNNDKLSLAVAKQLENEFGGWREWYPGKYSDQEPNQFDL
ncbi:fatty-acid amide hydrolase 2-A-like [Montipora capricornis]|uniref:fatty-acid amide hydrolase 2-A-like n=1 Tax=Montipora capricornis TaxID=246305 RepID=UPI0035F0FE0B